jgi:LPXTG-motif cell wall-anchored protein
VKVSGSNLTQRTRRLGLLAAVVACLGVWSATAALAQTGGQVCDAYGTCVSPSSASQTSSGPLVAPSSAARAPVTTAAQTAPTGTLPLTGADIAGLVILAGALFTVGGLLVLAGRRRRDTAVA